MRTQITTIGIFAIYVVLLFGCTKPDDPEIPISGTVKALRNNEMWNSECTALFSSQHENEVTLFFQRYNDDGYLREEFSISRIPTDNGSFSIVNRERGETGETLNHYGSNYFSYTTYGESIDGIYYVFESDSNYIEISDIDLITNDFVGNFKVTFVKDTTFDINPELPDTIRFTDGEFQVVMRETW